MQINKSHNAKYVLTRLKKALKVRTDLELSKLLDVRPNTLSTWKKRNSLDYALLISICKLYKIDLNQIFLGEKDSKSLINEEKNLTCLVSKNVLHEYVLGTFNENIEDLPSYKFPFVSAEHSRVFQVPTNNMFPLIEENSFAICEKTNLADVKDENVVIVISKRKGFFINRMVKKDESSVLLINENYVLNEQSIQLGIDDIDELWLVKGILIYNIINNKFQLMNSRIKRIENALTSGNVIS